MSDWYDGLDPDKPAAIMAGSGKTLTYGELDRKSAQLARLFRSRGLERGDRVGIIMENRLDWFVAIWAARRATLYFVPINWHLQTEEARYIVENSDLKALVTSEAVLDRAVEMTAGIDAIRVRLTADQARGGFDSIADAIRDFPTTPLDGECQGNPMFYSSGTSGRPKGILRPLTADPLGTPYMVETFIRGVYGVDGNTVYLSPAPQYHSAPMGFGMAMLVSHATIIMMENYDAEGVLRAIEQYKVTMAQFVPTHFVRLLKLPEAVRTAYELSTLKIAVHAAAPCPQDVKKAMIDWWGPILYEYYSGSESFGITAINSQEWLERPGSVGKPVVGIMHITDNDTGKALPLGKVGMIFFEGADGFEYHKDPVKTGECVNPDGWGTHGDMGWVDPDGYLYLADRKADLIISGGVNIYPQEAENALITHELVHDVAVFGIPNEEYGEEVKAMVQLRPGVAGDAALAAEMIAFCRGKIAHFKCPKTVDFVAELPRHPTGKLLKRQLREKFWPQGRRI